MLDYKKFIGEVVAYLLGIDKPWTDDQQFNEIFDDLYHKKRLYKQGKSIFASHQMAKSFFVQMIVLFMAAE